MKEEKYLFSENEIDLNIIKNQLISGKLIIYPTDTVYGVGGIMEENTISKIYKAKNRPLSSPLIVLISDRDKINKIAIIDSKNKDKVYKLMDKFWPGGLTIILPKKDIVPNNMVANQSTVGIRMPNLKLALDIIDSVGGILPTTSANISKHPTPKEFNEIEKIFIDKVDIVVNAPTTIGIESTIIDMTYNIPKILRVGAISIKEIENTIGKIQWEE